MSFAICDEDATCFTIDTNKTSETFSGIGSFGSRSSLIHGVNDGAIMIKGSTINEFSFITKICNCGGLGRIQCAVLCMFPMGVAKEIVLPCMISNILGSILKERVNGFSCGNTGGPEHFQVKG